VFLYYLCTISRKIHKQENFNCRCSNNATTKQKLQVLNGIYESQVLNGIYESQVETVICKDASFQRLNGIHQNGIYESQVLNGIYESQVLNGIYESQVETVICKDASFQRLNGIHQNGIYESELISISPSAHISYRVIKQGYLQYYFIIKRIYTTSGYKASFIRCADRN
jgi:hypothetical protein